MIKINANFAEKIGRMKDTITVIAGLTRNVLSSISKGLRNFRTQ